MLFASPLLEFLRNLTPQILLFSIALFIGDNLDFKKFDPSNANKTFLFFAVAATFFAAAIANAFMLIEKTFLSISSSKEKELEEIFNKEKNALRRIKIFTKAIIHKSKVMFIQMISILVIVTTGFVLVAFISIQNSVNLQNLFNNTCR